MLKRGTPPRLSAIVGLRMGLVSLVLTLLLVAYFATNYLLDIPSLRRATLEANVRALVRALQDGRDPASLWPYRSYPGAYGFRIFDHRATDKRRTLAEVNAQLLTAGTTDETSSDANPDPTLEEGFELVRRADGVSGEDRWLLTDRNQIGRRSYWIQAAMQGDPAGLWWGILFQELFDHVLLPVLFIVPALTVAMFLATRSALRPLNRIADQAADLGHAVAAGKALTPLPQQGLPLEFREVVIALNSMLVRMERSLQLQRQFTSDAAHELRTPLAVLLLETSQLPPSPAAGRIRDELQDLAALLNELLRFAQAEAAMTLELEPVDLSAAARKVCMDLATKAVARRVAIGFGGKSHVVVRGNPALIDAAIRNVVDNAVKFSPAGSTVSVSVGDVAQITVSDRGPGIPDAQKDLVFGRLWRRDHRGTDGAGIGLALVRRIAQMHGGEVCVADNPGGGAQFLLTLAPEKQSDKDSSTSVSRQSMPA